MNVNICHYIFKNFFSKKSYIDKAYKTLIVFVKQCLYHIKDTVI